VSVLDLGCGTGLLGASMGAVNGVLVGVDASAQMLERAGNHARCKLPSRGGAGCFYLDRGVGYSGAGHRPGAGTGRAAGVFMCAGAAARALRPSGRNVHQQQAIEALCNMAGLVQIKVQQVDLRLEAGAPVKGFLVVARKPV